MINEIKEIPIILEQSAAGRKDDKLFWNTKTTNAKSLIAMVREETKPIIRSKAACLFGERKCLLGECNLSPNVATETSPVFSSFRFIPLFLSFKEQLKNFLGFSDVEELGVTSSRKFS